LDFIGIGFTKSGSTWIYKILEEHPQIEVSKTKETNFFVTQDLENHPENLRYLKDFFGENDGKIRGEFSPMYINRDKALENIKRFYPKVKLLVILRNPVDKCISEVMYNYRFKDGMERADFDQILGERVKNAPPRSMYIEHLQKWMNNFPPENFHIMILEEMIADPDKKIAELYRFLGVDDFFRPEWAKKKANTAHAFRYPGLQKRLRNAHQRVKKHPRLAKALKKISRPFKLKQKILDWNRQEFQKPLISPKTRQALFNTYKDEIQKMEKLLNKDLSVWSNNGHQ
jgi:hypothetical protein